MSNSPAKPRRSFVLSLATLGIVPSASAASPKDAPAEFGEFAELEPVVVNPRGSEGHRYRMLKPAATDAIISLVSSQTAAQLNAISLRDSLKESIRTRFSEMLGVDGEISHVYLTHYVLQ